MRKANLSLSAKAQKQETRTRKLQWMELNARITASNTAPSTTDIDMAIVDWTLYLYSNEIATIEHPPIVLTPEMRKDTKVVVCAQYQEEILEDFFYVDLTSEMQKEQFSLTDLFVEGEVEMEDFVANESAHIGSVTFIPGYRGSYCVPVENNVILEDAPENLDDWFINEETEVVEQDHAITVYSASSYRYFNYNTPAMFWK